MSDLDDDDDGVDDGNILKILLATDIHLGYLENDPIRGQDTFVTFEEILQIANNKKVDFILLGGDLFHETKPSSYCIYKCIELLRRYTMGDKPVEFEILSDQSLNFQYTPTGMTNFEDPNLNIAIPVFSIHGNHDDPTGQKQISAMDIMSSTGLVNYFGRLNTVTNIVCEPILIGKGDTKLALYGISHIKDERFVRLLLDGKYELKIPDSENEWFNLLVWHQNRIANRGCKNFIPEVTIPKTMDLVFWGHEHQCIIKPFLANDIYITQPGSSVATSLCDAEAIPKHVGILSIKKKGFKIDPILLTTVRPFIFDRILLDRPITLEKDDCIAQTMNQISNKIDEMIERAKGLGLQSNLPLIRLIARYTDERQLFNAIRFGQKYMSKVANPMDILKFKSETHVSINKSKKRKLDIENNEEDDNSEHMKALKLEDFISKYFNEKNRLNVLSREGLNAAVKKLVEANDNDALSVIISHQEKKVIEKLVEISPNFEDTKQTIEEIRDKREAAEKGDDDALNILNSSTRRATKTDVITIDDDMEENDDSGIASLSTSTSSKAKGSRGRGRGRGGGGGRGKAKAWA